MLLQSVGLPEEFPGQTAGRGLRRGHQEGSNQTHRRGAACHL